MNKAVEQMYLARASATWMVLQQALEKAQLNAEWQAQYYETTSHKHQHAWDHLQDYLDALPVERVPPELPALVKEYTEAGRACLAVMLREVSK